MQAGHFLGVFLQIWLATVGALIFYRILTGRIPMGGLLRAGSGQFSPERLQMLVITLGTLGAYVLKALSEHRMPALDSSFVGVLGTSNLIYVGGKAARLFFNQKE